ncbi:MAG: ParB/RepB/Spo0J family partition protein [Acidobacteriaceae bacterium]|nr:ParB/RepB/Spo0J family partition protein [Acidobacteriaceae bacterium]
MNKEVDRNPRKALGKGLSALLPTRSGSGAMPVREANGPAAAPAAAPASEPLPEHFEAFQEIPLHQISPGTEQPRTNFDTEKLMELAQSIRIHGVIQPITVQKVAPQKYKIIAGERRWKAAGLAGLDRIPALVRNAERDERLQLALIENLQREDLNPIEIAQAFQKLTDDYGLSHEEIAERTGKERPTITNFLRLLRLSPFVRDALARGAVSMGHGRALLQVENEHEQSRLCDQIIAQQLSVRATERLAKNFAEPRNVEWVEKNAPALDPNVKAAIADMESALGTRVRLTTKSDGSGRLEIEYYSQDDLDRIYSVIVRQ